MHEIRLKALSLANHFTKKIYPYCQLSGEGDGGWGVGGHKILAAK